MSNYHQLGLGNTRTPGVSKQQVLGTGDVLWHDVGPEVPQLELKL